MAGSNASDNSFNPWLSGWSGRLSDPGSRFGGGKTGLYELASAPLSLRAPMYVNPQAPAARNPAIIGTQGRIALNLSVDLLCAMVPKLKKDRASSYVSALNLYLNRYEINTERRLAAFMGQVVVESTGFTRVTENLYYSSAERLHSVFPSRFKTVKSAEDYTKNPEKVANHVYSDKLGNGNEASGDGWKYRGRGLIQITGKSNYDAFKRASGIDVVASPELIEQPTYAVYSAAWFWHNKGLNGLADGGNYLALTKRINAPALHFTEREAAREHAQRVLQRASLYDQGVMVP